MAFASPRPCLQSATNTVNSHFLCPKRNFIKLPRPPQHHQYRQPASHDSQPAAPRQQLSLSSSPTGVEQQIPNQPAGRTIYQIPKPSTTSLPQILPASQARDLPRFARLSGRKENWLAGLGDCGQQSRTSPSRNSERCFGLLLSFLIRFLC